MGVACTWLAWLAAYSYGMYSSDILVRRPRGRQAAGGTQQSLAKQDRKPCPQSCTRAPETSVCIAVSGFAFLYVCVSISLSLFVSLSLSLLRPLSISPSLFLALSFSLMYSLAPCFRICQQYYRHIVIALYLRPSLRTSYHTRTLRITDENYVVAKLRHIQR